jgi:hypothetical protein
MTARERFRRLESELKPYKKVVRVQKTVLGEYYILTVIWRNNHADINEVALRYVFQLIMNAFPNNSECKMSPVLWRELSNFIKVDPYMEGHWSYVIWKKSLSS